ncbi:cation:proton antiporter [Nocardioides pacificus]
MTADGVFLIGGLCLLLAVVLPSLLQRYALSSPIVLVGVGMVLGLTPLFEDISFSPGVEADRAVIEHVTEIAVLVALMGVGLALDRPLNLRSWSSWGRWSATWRLLGVTMPLTIAAIAAIGWWAGGLSLAGAVLLGAVLAPTDPVLASDVQVGGPAVDEDADEMEIEPDHEDEEGHEHDEVRFALTAEAGLNDGLAFPFVYLAILLAAAGSFAADDATHWLSWYLLGKVALGVAGGLLVGWGLGKIAFRLPSKDLRLAEQGEPLLAIAALLTAYGVAEVAGGYGFLAVFTCAMTLRAQERRHDYHRAMHEVIERLERLLTLVILLFLGIEMTNGLLDYLDLWGVLVAVATIFVIRPLAGLIGLGAMSRRRECVGGLTVRERRAVAFFGVRGVGSLYYLAYATGEAEFAEAPWLWSTAAFTIVLSVLVHGVTAKPWMARLDRDREAEGQLS